MLERLLRRISMLLLVGAFVSATILQVPLSASAAGTEMTMPDRDGGNGNSMPCKSGAFDCQSDLGCIFLISLPAPQSAIAAILAWSSVVYDLPSSAVAGRSIEPDLGPPIPSA